MNVAKFEIKQDQDLSDGDLTTLHQLLVESFEGDFSYSDWEHTFGGIRFVGKIDDTFIAHVAVVPRTIHIDDVPHSIGYVEGLAVSREFQGNGFGKALMLTLSEYCLGAHELSLLSTGEKAFYRPFGWQDFLGESFVLHDGISVRSAEEDSGLMLLSRRPERYLSSKLACEARSGDAW